MLSESGSLECETPLSIRVKNPLSDVTRRDRKWLLFLSVVSFALSFAGIVPSRISALGIELGTVDQRWLIVLLGLVTLYFFCSFLVYAIADLLRWRLDVIYVDRAQLATSIDGMRETAKRKPKENPISAALVGRAVKEIMEGPSEEKRQQEFEKKLDGLRDDFERNWKKSIEGRTVSRLVRPIGVVRGLLEFAVPSIVGVLSMWALASKYLALVTMTVAP